MQHTPVIWGTLDPFVEGGPIIGRKVANTGFLEALLRTDPFDQYHFFLQDEQVAKDLQAYLDIFPQQSKKVRFFPRTALSAQLQNTVYHAFHLSDCLTSQGFLAALRNRVAKNIFPITGVTHSLSYARYGQAFAQHAWNGVTPRDCVVATSRAGQEAVRQILSAYQEHFGHVRVPEVERIPLGVWCSEFTGDADPALCQSLGIGETQTVFLVPGRISPYSKMDVLPLLRAFQRLGKAGVDLSGVCLVLAGGTDESASLPETLAALAANIGLALFVVRCPDDKTKKSLLVRSNVVVSLADNPQETFGLTLLEAAAAGKPVIVSDYDGYRDLVCHGKTGLLVPTLDRGVEDVSLLAPLLYDSTYHMWLAQDVAVSVEHLAEALQQMLVPQLRERMGRAAHEHAARFDWPEIIRQYMALWERLHVAPAPEPGQGACRHPLALDFSRVFKGYASARLDDSCLLESTDLGRAVYRGQDYPVLYAGMEDRVDLALMRRILVWTRHALSWSDLREKAGANDRLGSTVMWMLKGDLLRVVR